MWRGSLFTQRTRVTHKPPCYETTFVLNWHFINKKWLVLTSTTCKQLTNNVNNMIILFKFSGLLGHFGSWQYSLVGIMQISGSPKVPDWFENISIGTILWAEIFTESISRTVKNGWKITSFQVSLARRFQSLVCLYDDLACLSPSACWERSQPLQGWMG